MNNFVEQVVIFSAQGDADDVFDIPLDTHNGPMSLVSVMVRVDAVAGSPTDVDLDVDITDGTTTRAAIAAQSIGTAAGTKRLAPTAADMANGLHLTDQEDAGGSSPAFWRAQIDFNFTGGTSPTVTGTAILRWAV